MKKNNPLLNVTAIAFLLIVSIFLHVENIWGQECRLIRLHGMRGGTNQVLIEPETTVIKKDTCVVWVNFVRSQEVIVKFAEGKKCKAATGTPRGFKFTAENCYVSTLVPLGGTSSLRFVEDGTYDYVVEASPTIKEKGKIIVVP